MTSTHQQKIARMSSTEDIISSLPDALISHILSFLPTKLAVATSVLSKRWTPLWKSVLTLDIYNESFKDSESFRQFAHSLVVMRNATLPIRRIRCVISSIVDPRDLNRFVEAAAQGGLEICDLNCETIPRLFSCKTLVVLKLAFLEVHEVPNLVDLPLLKTLHLYRTKFTCSFVQFMNLLHGCPILEELIMYYPQIPNDFVEVEEFKGFSKLVKAYIRSKESFLFRWLYNVKFLRGVVVTWDCFYGVPPTFHNLTNMVLDLCHSRRLKWELVIQVLQHCPNLQKLTIDEDFANFILPTGDGDWTEPETIPKCLSSQLRKCFLRGFRAMECEFHFAEYILLNSKLLCTMTVKSNYYLDSDSDEKHQILVKLSSYPRGSAICKLLFDSQPVFIS